MALTKDAPCFLALKGIDGRIARHLGLLTTKQYLYDTATLIDPAKSAVEGRLDLSNVSYGPKDVSPQSYCTNERRKAGVTSA